MQVRSQVEDPAEPRDHQLGPYQRRGCNSITSCVSGVGKQPVTLHLCTPAATPPPPSPFQVPPLLMASWMSRSRTGPQSRRRSGFLGLSSAVATSRSCGKRSSVARRACGRILASGGKVTATVGGQQPAARTTCRPASVAGTSAALTLITSFVCRSYQ